MTNNVDLVLSYETHRITLTRRSDRGSDKLIAALSVGYPGVRVVTADATLSQCQVIAHEGVVPQLWIGSTAFRIDTESTSHVNALLSVEQTEEIQTKKA